MNHTNQMARRVTVANAIVSLIPAEHSAVRATDDFGGGDAARMARLNRHMGDVADSLLYASRPVEDDLLKVAAAAMAWIDRIGEERAR